MGSRVDYERHGRTYARFRRTDPRIAERIHASLGDARTVLNVGAGGGSYEPDDRCVWRSSRARRCALSALRGPRRRSTLGAEALPFDDDAVDAAMACITIHHWDPPEAGLAELRRVARGPVVVFTFELDGLPSWQQEHLAEGLAIERPRFPSMKRIAAALGGRVRVERVPTPGDCLDGFFEAFWRRPEALLDPDVRASQSMWALLAPGVEGMIVERLSEALASGTWNAEHGHLRRRETFNGALRLVISEPA